MAFCAQPFNYSNCILFPKIPQRILPFLLFVVLNFRSLQTSSHNQLFFISRITHKVTKLGSKVVWSSGKNIDNTANHYQISTTKRHNCFSSIFLRCVIYAADDIMIFGILYSARHIHITM